MAEAAYKKATKHFEDFQKWIFRKFCEVFFLWQISCNSNRLDNILRGVV